MAVPDLARLELAPPPRGEATLLHDPTFTAWDETFSTMRDTVNLGIAALNHAGAGLPRLPEGSLEDLLVLPLTGDYGAIRQNATACHDVRDALHTWGDNILRLSVGVRPGWGGDAAAAYLLRINAYGLVARGLGEVVAGGSVVFEQVAVVSEKIGIRVERLIVSLGKALVRLARRLLSKVAGPAGWATFAAELVTRGLDTVTDIVNDVQLVLALVQTLRELHDTVRSWVGEQRQRLAVLADLPGLVRS